MTSTSPWRLVGALLGLGLSGCVCVPEFGPPDEEQEADGGECPRSVLQSCDDWRCAGGQLVQRVPAIGQTTEVTGTLSGQYVTNDLQVIDFTVATTNGVTRATYRPNSAPCAELNVELTDREHASFTWDGVRFDGRGALSAAQLTALASFKRSPYVGAVTSVPLELGCHPDVGAAHLAALLFPLQVLLKYDVTPNSRAAGLEALGQGSTCGYFGERADLHRSPRIDGEKRLGPLQFARADLVPHVFGYFALDGSGATEATTQPLEGDLTGPCSARCRGACGPDCPDTCTARSITRCSTDGGVDEAVDEFDCGVHDGCVKHDDCYDDCHRSNACGSWGAAFCRRGCDSDAVAGYGIDDTSDWARGKGPFQRRVTFAYARPSPGACSCVAPGTEVTLADGSSQAIETLSQGQQILAFDVDAGVIIRANIELVLVHGGHEYTLDRLQAASGEELELTGNHPVFTQRGFVRTEDLGVGDTVFIVDEAAAQTRQERLISIIRKSATSNVTYNLKTSAGNYFAADLLIHNKCLAGESLIETPEGEVAISTLQPGDLVRGVEAGVAVWTPVRAVYRKDTALPSLPGRVLSESVRLTDNHVLSLQGRAAGELGLPSTAIEGAVFDLETGTGNFVAGGVLLEAGR